jgi:hypothetical protein
MFESLSLFDIIVSMSGQSTTPAPDEDLQKKCADEYARFLAARETLTKSELEAEKNYDTLLVSLSTLAIASSFTILKDVVRSSSASALIVLSWLTFGLCLLIALTDRLLTYYAHRKYRQFLDAEFTGTWAGPGAFERAQAKYEQLKWRKPIKFLKWTAAGFLAIGLVLLMMFVFIGTGQPVVEAKPASPVIVNVYNSATPTTAPTTNPSAPR